LTSFDDLKFNNDLNFNVYCRFFWSVTKTTIMYNITTINKYKVHKYSATTYNAIYLFL